MGKQELKIHQLIEECVRGNRKYEELLYKSYYGYLAGVAFRYVSGRDEIRQLVNASFLRIFKKLDRFRFDGQPAELEKAFKGWIGKITANIAIDHLRSQKKLYYVDDMSEEQLGDLTIEISDRLAYQEVIALLDTLPPLQRIIFNLYEIEGFNHEEIAQKLQFPASTSRVYLTRAKIRLMANYQQMMKVSYEK
ncbi:RNA polymerase sigma factor [Mucilaginibacter sp. dw_454]|uniref:RNA polymerase sigma factor n=1 Tax=Mucilaginibacter sp. dw_454 TaxID=2720079 RepID=UPI001BD583F0